VLFAASGIFVVTQRQLTARASSDICHIELARDFISFQHRLRDIEYDNIEIYTAVNLYDAEHEVVASAVILYRDGEFDYVVMNLITEQIDEWGINEQEVVAHFKSGERIYFGGALTYSVRDGHEYVDFNGTRLDGAEFTRRSREFGEATRRYRNESRRRRTITSSDIENGFLSWADIVARHHSSVTVGLGYLQGINWNGITGSGLSFASQSTLNQFHLFRHGVAVTGTCGPVMQVNLLIYLQWRGFNVLTNGSIHDTFDRALILSDWRPPTGGTLFRNNRDATRAMIRERGYNYVMHTFGSAFAGFRDSINRGHPAMMEIHRAGNQGHGVVVVGYEHFRQGTTNFHYLRVIDGWGTSNASRFVNFNGFFSGINGASFWIA